MLGDINTVAGVGAAATSGSAKLAGFGLTLTTPDETRELAAVHSTLGDPKTA